MRLYFCSEFSNKWNISTAKCLAYDETHRIKYGTLLSLVRTIVKTTVYMGPSWCILGRVKSSKLDIWTIWTTKAKFGLIQPLFPNDDMLARIIRVLSVPRRKNDDHKLHDLWLYFADLYFNQILLSSQRTLHFITRLSRQKRDMLPKAN